MTDRVVDVSGDPTAADRHTVVIGAGPAGLTAAYDLVRHDCPVTVLEASDVVGGISQTVDREGWLFDIGGHRFFTKVPEVQQLWHEILPQDEFLLRPRLSRILYGGKLFDYPLKASNALKGLGVLEAIRCVLSYLWVKVHPPKDQTTFEGWVAARFGWRLYGIFFKTYTEKVWGMSGSELQADWAAQRIKNLSLGSAIVRALVPSLNKGKDITSLIEEFEYPKYGPGLMWQTCRDKVEAGGGKVRMHSAVELVHHEGGRATAVTALSEGGATRYDCTGVISSMPLSALVRAFDPPVPDSVRAAADGLRYRDFLTVALVVPEEAGFPDNWVYVHEVGVRVGRVQNFGSWSPYMVKEGRTCLGLEYFVNEGDDLWSSTDEELVALATRELHQIGLVDGARVETGYVVRVHKAYPVYDADYAGHVETIKTWLAENAPNVVPVGRNGMHKYNNQDHSMVTALIASRQLRGVDDGASLWEVNVEEDYHEGGDAPARRETPASSGTGSGTGRDAPHHPVRAIVD